MSTKRQSTIANTHTHTHAVCDRCIS